MLFHFMKSQLNFNTFLIIVTGAVVTLAVHKLDENNTLIIQFKAQLSNTMDEVKELRTHESEQDKRIDKVESRVDFLEKKP